MEIKLSDDQTAPACHEISHMTYQNDKELKEENLLIIALTYPPNIKVIKQAKAIDVSPT